MNVEARAMLVRLAALWIDSAGVVHGAGEHVDVDAVTLAELEEQGVVENMTNPEPEWPVPDSTVVPTPTDPTTDFHGPDKTEPSAEPDFHGPDSTEPVPGT